MEQNNIEQNDINRKVIIRSISPWTTGMRRITQTGDITIQPMGQVTLSPEEIVAQVQSGNRLLLGVDSYGSHATLYIEDEAIRRELEFDTDEKKQAFIALDDIKKAFQLKIDKSFHKRIEEIAVTRAEKTFLMNAIKKLKINDYDRVRFCEDYTGMRVEK